MFQWLYDIPNFHFSTQFWCNKCRNIRFYYYSLSFPFIFNLRQSLIPGIFRADVISLGLARDYPWLLITPGGVISLSWTRLSVFTLWKVFILIKRSECLLFSMSTNKLLIFNFLVDLELILYDRNFTNTKRDSFARAMLYKMWVQEFLEKPVYISLEVTYIFVFFSVFHYFDV